MYEIKFNLLGTNKTTWALANNNSISVQEEFQTIKNTALDITNLNNSKINIDGFTVETKLISSEKNRSTQNDHFRLIVTGNSEYFSEVDYNVTTYSNGRRVLTINWTNVVDTPSYVPVGVGVALHKYSGSTYDMYFWQSNNTKGVNYVNKSFTIENNWTVQVELSTVNTIGNPGLPGTTYIPKTIVRNH